MRTYLFLLVCVTASCVAQTPELDFMKMNSAYNDLNSFSCTVEYQYFENYDSPKETEKLTGIYLIKKEKYRLEIGNTILVFDGNLLLSIDEKLHQIVIKQSNTDQLNIGEINPKQLNKESKKFKSQGLTNHSIVYRYNNSETSNSGLCYTDVELNNVKWFIESISTYYKNMSIIKDGKYVMADPKIKISYTNQKTDIELNDSLFRVNRWVTKQNNLFVLTEEFQDYELMVI